MKILTISYNQIDKYNWGHELFRREMSRSHDVVFFGPGHTDKKIGLFDFLKSINHDIYDFDFVFTYGLKYTRKIKDIYNLPDNICKVHYVIDYFKPKGKFIGRASEQHDFLNKYKPDIVFTVYHDSVKPLKKNILCKNIFVLPFSVCTRTYVPLNYEKKNIVATCFSRRTDAYPDRIIALNYLREKDITILDRQTNYDYIRAINSCKVILGVNDIYGSLNMRVTEILACGGLFVTNKPRHIEKLNLISGVHYVEYSDFNDMIEKIKFYFKHDEKRIKISKNGMALVRDKHSCEQRIREMIEFIKKVKK